MTQAHTTDRYEGYQGILAFELPAPWTGQQLRPEVELFGSMPAVQGEFTPNVVVTVNPYSGTVQDFGRLAVSGIVADLTEGRIVDVSEWDFRPGASTEEALGHSGRIIEYTHRAPVGRTVSGVDYLVIHQGWAIQISTTTALQTRHLFAEEFEAIARSVSVLQPAADTEEKPAGEESSSGSPEASVDEVASRARGEVLEDYSFYQAAGSWIGEGTWLTGAAIARMGELEDSVLGRLGLGAKDPVLAELQELGVLEGGRLSEIGDVMAAMLNGATTRMRLTGRFLDGETMLQAFVVGDLALVAAEQGYGPRVLNQSWHPDDETMFNVQLIPLSELSSCASRWVGAGPAWNVHVEPLLLQNGQLDERLAGETPLPSGANEAMEQVWNHPWFIWEIQAEGDTTSIDPITYVNVGPRGNYRIGLIEHPETGRDHPGLWATDSSYILWQLEDVLQAVVFGRDVQLG
ncbi:MAG: hypothetical protein L0I99_00020 [Micrococcaceae bacterium]|nr:hypothetical protein [Micrococcaceae bacterium]